MAKTQLQPLSFVIFVSLTFFFSGIASAVDVELNRQLQETIAQVQTDETLGGKTRAAEHLAQLTRNAVPTDVDDRTLADMISLLDSPYDSVRAWVAGALGNLGPRASLAIPKLLSVLPKSDCLYVELSSAPFIRVAIKKIGGNPPPACYEIPD